MPEIDSVDTRLQNWLEQRGLRANPFAAWNAELEPDLPNYFVDVEQFDDLLRLDVPCIVFAKRGCGKTARRQMLAAQCRPHEPESTRLAIHYTFDGFEYVLSQANEDVKQVRPIHHVNALVYLGLAALLQAIASEAARPSGLTDQAAASRLAGYVARFAPHLQPTWLTETPAALDQTNPRMLLKGFVKLLEDAGLKACVVLVDGLDEFSPTATDPAQIATFLAPLLGILPLVESSDIAFKFFLPAELEPALRAQPWFRPDRLRLFHITWDGEGLLHLIKQRLIYFSEKETLYESLGQLCEDRLAQVIDQELIALTGRLPRAALVLADMLLQYHCRQPDPPELITLGTWEKVKIEWQVRRADFPIEASPIVSTPATEPVSSPMLNIVGYPVLRVAEEKGLVWLGECDITGKITPKEYQVLACLYKRRDALCTKEDLAQEAWPEEAWAGISDETITQTFTRLRRILQSVSRGVQYIETVRGRGYRLHPAGFKAKQSKAKRGKTKRGKAKQGEAEKAVTGGP